MKNITTGFATAFPITDGNFRLYNVLLLLRKTNQELDKLVDFVFDGMMNAKLIKEEFDGYCQMNRAIKGKAMLVADLKMVANEYMN